jgi:hypothetical protein
LFLSRPLTEKQMRKNWFNLNGNILFVYVLAHLPYLEGGKGGLWDHIAVCSRVPPNSWAQSCPLYTTSGRDARKT